MHEDLLRQALQLATADSKRPKQVNLRRAVSAAYYALFHYLVDESCKAVAGRQHIQAPYRNVLGRAFAHGTMKQACLSFSGGSLKATVARGLPASFAIPHEMKTLAAVFTELQEVRHIADYDRSAKFTRSDVLSMIAQARRALENFDRLARSNEKTFFLACLWAWKELANR